jgi:hypothetical protein
VAFEVEAALLAVSAAVRCTELRANGTVEGGIPHLVADAEEVVFRIPVAATHPVREVGRQGLNGLAQRSLLSGWSKKIEQYSMLPRRTYA